MAGRSRMFRDVLLSVGTEKYVGLVDGTVPRMERYIGKETTYMTGVRGHYGWRWISVLTIEG
jgi:hypothetical protein